MARSLRAELLGWLLVPLAAVVAFNVWTTHRIAFATASLITDRTLLASAQVIAEQVKDNDGNIEALIPPSAIEMFASPDRDRVIYRVTAPSGELLAGYPDVAVPPAVPTPAQPVYFEARFRTEAIRAVAIAQPVISRTSGGNAIVVVAQTLKGRDRLAADRWFKALRDQVVLVGLAALLAVFGLKRGLAPLAELGSDLAKRDPGSLRPLSVANVQTELRPLVDALNQAFDRIENYIALQRRFVANASHQMRTPLALLKTQATVGRRETDPRAKDDAIAAIDLGIDSLSRLVNQLLTLARAEPGGAALRKETVDFVGTVHAALERLGTVAFARGIDLTFDTEPAKLPLHGHASLLQELVVNLVDNALKNTPAGGTVAVQLAWRDDMIFLSIEDTGPGIAESERGQVFERFYRVPGSASEGTGLGLAIVREILAAHGGRISLSARAGGPGLRVEVAFPGLGAREAPPAR